MQKVPSIDRCRPVSACIVYRAKARLVPEFLILRRHPEEQPYPGEWTPPSGGLKVKAYLNKPQVNGGWEDVMEETARDEVREEAGIEVGDLTYLSSFLTVREHDQVPVVGLRFIAPYKSGQIRLDKHHVDHTWITAQETHMFNLIGNVAMQIKTAHYYLQARLS